MIEKRKAITGIIREHAKANPMKAAIIVGDEIVNYGELFDKISSAAAFFKNMGIREGSHVVTVANHSFNYVICMYALLGMGAVHIPVENNVPLSRLKEISCEVDAEMIISPEKPDCARKWISHDMIDMDNGDINWEPVSVSDDCSEIIFTTGTTGKSKGVMLSSHCLETYIAAMSPSFKLDKDSVFLVTTPLNHIGGLHRIHQCMAANSTVILMDGVRNLFAFFTAIHNYSVTHTYLPPASVKLLITLAKKELAKLDGKLKFIYTASAPFPVADIETLISLLPNTNLHQGYGSSETGSVCNCCYNAPGESVDCLGKPYPCVEVKLLDENGAVITEANKEGLICVKSDMNMIGYYNEPELTATVLKDGFIHSSDLMYFDEKGSLHFAGRGDDVINVKGFKVAPIEVENCAMRHPAINDCVCIPYDDKLQGRVVKMLVCINDGYAFDTEEITEYISNELEAYKVPKYIEMVEKIVRTNNGKINRKEIIKLYSNV